MQAPTLKTKAIVTRAVPYNESDIIITLVGVEFGKLTATVRGCLKPKAKLRFAAEPLNFGDYVLSGRNGRYVVTECSQITSFFGVTADLDKYYASFMILDALEKFSSEPQPALFVSALKKLGELEEPETDTDRLVMDFLSDILKISGSGLDFAHCGICGCEAESEMYLNEGSGVVCKHCKGFFDSPIDSLTLSCLRGEKASHGVMAKANIMLADFVYKTSGIRIAPRYFTEQL